MFDPYRKWLGIPPKDQPPNHYRLLGIDLFEVDAEVIDAAANKQMAYIQGCATGPQMSASQKLLNECAAARLCLLDPKKKAGYDDKLKAKMGSENKPPTMIAYPVTTGHASRLAARRIEKRSKAILLAIAGVVAILALIVGSIAFWPNDGSPVAKSKLIADAKPIVSPFPKVEKKSPTEDVPSLPKPSVTKKPSVNDEKPTVAKDIPVIEKKPLVVTRPPVNDPEPVAKPSTVETAINEAMGALEARKGQVKEKIGHDKIVAAIEVLDTYRRKGAAALPAPGIEKNQSPPPNPALLKLKPGSLQGRSGLMRKELLSEGGGNDKTEAAVALGLKWIASQQRNDGSWTIDDRGFEIAATGLGLLPFLGAGNTHKQGVYSKNVNKGLVYLLGKQLGNGSIGETYVHAIATIAVCEAYGMSGDQKLRLPAQRAVDYIVAAQHQGGGWRYKPKEPGDTSATGWHFMALKTADMAGLKVPKESIGLVGTFLDGVATPDGGYGYNSRAPSVGCTASGLLCREFLGWSPTRPEMMRGIGILRDHSPPNGGTNIYYYYHATQVMRHFGGDEWKAWNGKMQEMLLPRQLTGEGAGSWSPVGDEYEKQGGRIMVTSLSLLTLEVYYRHVPLFLSEGSKGEER
jgi:hypothetical protein